MTIVQQLRNAIIEFETISFSEVLIRFGLTADDAFLLSLELNTLNVVTEFEGFKIITSDKLKKSIAVLGDISISKETNVVVEGRLFELETLTELEFEL